MERKKRLEEGRVYRFRLEAVCCFEAADERVFAYTKMHVYEQKGKLYQVEEAYAVLYINERRSAVRFNEQLKRYQEEIVLQNGDNQ